MKRFIILIIVLSIGFIFAQDIRVDGSSTVYPITLAISEEFNIENPQYDVSVAFSGTGGGFKKFCVGETHINDASRPIKSSEVETCAANGIEFTEIKVAWDALTVVVNPDNDWVDCLTVEQLNLLWEPGSTVKKWSDLSPDWPQQEVALFAPGVDSGTFDYFTEAINGEGGASRTDFFPSEDDTVLVQGVEGNRYAMGYFGFAYYLEEGSKLKAVRIYDSATQGGDTNSCVEPSVENIDNGTYTPLSRPLFIYVNNNAMDENPALAAFIEFYTSDDNQWLIAETGYAPLSE